MLLLYVMRKIETLARSRAALAAFCFVLLSFGAQAQDAPVNAPEVTPILNSCALIEDRTERETCSNQGIMEHIMNKLEYPKEAQKAGIEGTVIVKFVINKTGQVSETKVLKGPEELAKAAENVVRGLPGFTPGTQNGKPVNVELVLPIRFALSND
jgi:TonB family protein